MMVLAFSYQSFYINQIRSLAFDTFMTKGAFARIALSDDKKYLAASCMNNFIFEIMINCANLKQKLLEEFTIEDGIEKNYQV